MTEYDQIKGMLGTIRKFRHTPSSKIIKEQTEDTLVINGVDVDINSEDTMDLDITEDEKGKISQMIDDFRTEISPVADIDTIKIYGNSVSMNGKIPTLDVGFILSAGDDEGIYLTNVSMIKIDDKSMEIIQKIKSFEDKFITVMDEILINRKEN